MACCPSSTLIYQQNWNQSHCTLWINVVDLKWNRKHFNTGGAVGFTTTRTSNKISPRFYSRHKSQFPVEAASEICSTCLHSDIIVRKCLTEISLHGNGKDFRGISSRLFCCFDVPCQADWKLLLLWQFLFFSARFKLESCQKDCVLCEAVPSLFA